MINTKGNNTMIIKKLLPFLLFFLILSCTSFQFGNKQRVFIDEDEKKNTVREFNLSYSYKAMGIPVKGSKSIVEATFSHPETNTLFLCISFPKVGILQTEDNGITFRKSFFKFSLLDKIYGYMEDEDDEENESEIKRKDPFRFFYHFASSPIDPDKIVITMGPFILLSKNNGIKWEAKSIYFDIESVKIRDVFINEDEEIIILTKDKISISKNWGKRWKTYSIKTDEYSALKLEYLTGFYDNTTDTLYASLKHKDEENSLLSKKSYDYFYKNKRINLKSGLYYSYDKGKTWKKSDIPVPVALWKYNNQIYGSPIYPLGFYKENFSDKFKRSSLYRQALLDNNVPQQHLTEYANKLLHLKPEDYQILSLKNNRLITFNDIEEDIQFIDENNFSNIYTGASKLQYLDAIHWEDLWYEKKKSNNFLYEYNFWMLFKKWTGMRTNDPVLYTKDNKNTYYRLIPDPNFVKVFLKYSIEKQMEINSKKPFLKKETDKEFFDPQLDPTNGFPAQIEYSTDNGKTWKKHVDSKHIGTIIDPLNNKRSGFYWFKNVEKKKVFKLQISFGFDKGVSYLTYPLNILSYENDILLRMNYFSIANSYKDLYLVPNKF